MNKKTYLYISALILGVAFLNILLPWYCTAILMAFLILSFLVLVKIELVLSLLIIAVVVAGTQPHLIFDLRWSTVIDRYPLVLLPLILILFARLLLDRASGLRNGLDHHPLNVAVLFLFAWAGLTLFWVPYFQHSVVQFTVLAYNLMLFYLLIHFVDNEITHKRLMWCLILSGLVVLSIAFVIINIDLTRYHVYLEKGIKIEFTIPGGQQSLIGFGWSGHELAMTINFIMSVAAGMMIAENKIPQKALLGIIIIIMYITILSAMTKGGFIAFIVMAHFLIVAMAKLRKNLLRNLLVFYLVAVSIFIAHIALSGDLREPRLLVYGGKGSFSFSTRLQLWKFGFQELTDTSGLGLGIGTYSFLKKPAPHAHNMYFDYIFDFGFVGAVFVAVVLGCFVRYTWRSIQHQSSYLQIMRIATIGGLVSIGTHGLFDFGYNNTPIWMILGLCAATFTLAEKEAHALSDTREQRMNG